MVLVKADIKEAGYNKPVIKEIKLAIEEGQTIMLVGPSGSGKTTILLALTGVLKSLLRGYVKGTVRIAGVNPLERDGFERIPRLVGVALQDPDRQLAMPTPLDEIMFTLENIGYNTNSAEKKALKVLEEFGLKEKALHPSENLSGGEKRRLTFAASVAHDPKLLLLDEPTASVDSWGVRIVREFVKSMKERRGIIIVEHKARFFFDLVDLVILVKEGTVIGSWPPGEVPCDLLEAEGVDASAPSLKPPPGNPGEIVFRAHGLAYNPSVKVSVEEFIVRRGELVALVGPNGSGKTTLMKALAGLAGFEGEIKCKKPAEGRCAFYVPQNPDYMFMYPTVSEEAEKAGRGGIVNPRSEEIVRLYPRRSPYKLSHGQRRWLALSIALSYPAAVYMLDEPTTGLDLSLYREFKRRISTALSRGASFIVATHDVRVVSDLANRVYVIREGKVRESSREEVIKELEDAWVMDVG